MMAKIRKREENRYGLPLFGILLSLAIFFSLKIPQSGYSAVWTGWKNTDVILFGVILIITECGSYAAMHGLDLEAKATKATKAVKAAKALAGRQDSIFAFLAIFCSWFPFFLAFYPGNLSPDSYSSIYQALNQITSTAHPVLFTLMVRVCLRTGLFLFQGDMNAAVAVYSVAQMLLLAGTLAYCVGWLLRCGVPRWFAVLSVIYFAWNPLIARYSFTMWKDIPFSAVLLLLVLKLYDMTVCGKAGRKDWISFMILSVLASFLRNRVIYLVIVCYVVLLILYHEKWKKLLPVFLGTAAAVCLIQGPGYDALGIRASNFSEAVGVQLQQVACVVANGGDLTEEQEDFLDQIIPLETIPEVYNPTSVDTLKGADGFSHDFLNAYKAEFIQLWLELLPSNLDSYLYAWAMNTRGYWGFSIWFEPFAITWENESLGIYQTNIVKNLTGLDLEYLSNGILLNIGRVPVVRRFFDLGALAWLTVFCFFRQMKKRRYRLLMPLFPLLAVWVTLLLTTPVFREVRYMFVFHLSLPVVVMMLFLSPAEMELQPQGESE